MTTILFTRSDDFVSAIVRWFTKSAASHVGVCFDFDGIALVVHAYGRGGVQVQRRSTFLAERIPVAEFTVDVPTSLGPLLHEIGDKYDVPSLFHYVARRLGMRFQHPTVTPDARVCSELVALLPIRAFCDLDPEMSSPQTLLKRCRTSSELTEINASALG